MRILFLTQIVPYPLDAGPKIKTYHVLRYLANAGHSITLVSFVRTEQEKQALSVLEPYCRGGVHPVRLRRSPLADIRHLIQSIPSATPFLIRRDYSPVMARAIHSLLDQAAAQGAPYDVIHTVRPNMAQYAACVKTKLILDTENAEWTILRRMQQHENNPVKKTLLSVECAKMRSYEGRVCRDADAVLAVSEVDRRALTDTGAEASKITVIPIAVDCQQIQSIQRVSASQEILMVSTLFYPPNADGVRWFINQVYPLVRQAVPDATLTIIGPRPPKDITQFAIRNSQFVTVTGYVPDLQPYLERAALTVVPVRAASGMRVRILEALARGIPVVTTTTGVEGIDAVHGEHLLIADEPQSFAMEVVRLLQDASLRRRLAENGRRLVQEKYDWRMVLPKLEAVYQTLMKGKL